MEKKVLIISNNKSNLLDAIKYSFDQEQIEYVVVKDNYKIDKDITNIIVVGKSEIPSSKVPLILFEESKVVLSNRRGITNYVITNLVNDVTDYTDVQKEYLFKRGIYNSIMKKLMELLDEENVIDGLIIDFSECKNEPSDWVFNFDSISETYTWLSAKTKNLKNNFVQKTINFYHDKIYNDAIKEINYLAEKIMDIKNKKHILDIFICTKEELGILKNNYFFKLLVKNISNNYKLYIIDREKLSKEEPQIYSSILDGVSIYNDCVYIDTYEDEYSLGFVDCKEETIKKYNEYFDYILEKYAKRIDSESDIYGI